MTPPSPSGAVATPRHDAPRIRFIDALRGIAALAVVLHHYNLRLDWPILEYGNLGVAVFFVLSGFVVTLSVGAARISGRFLGRFALRRVLRLDPPYWVTMALVIAVGYAAGGRVSFDGVTTPQVLAHMFYLQDALGYQPILPVFWTLCYEVQFYLSFVLLLWAVQASGVSRVGTVLVTLGASVADRALALTPSPFMGRFWFCFALGTLVCWRARGEAAPRVVHGAIVAVFVFGVVAADGYALMSALTAAAIAMAIQAGRPDALSGRAWQFLGRISYSLYLTHLLFGWLALRLAERVMPAVPAVTLGVAVALVSAWVFYVLIERPAVRFSRAMTERP